MTFIYVHFRADEQDDPMDCSPDEPSDPMDCDTDDPMDSLTHQFQQMRLNSKYQ